MAQSSATERLGKRNGLVLHRASARAPGQLFKNYQWTRTKDTGRGHEKTCYNVTKLIGVCGLEKAAVLFFLDSRLSCKEELKGL